MPLERPHDFRTGGHVHDRGKQPRWLLWSLPWLMLVTWAGLPRPDAMAQDTGDLAASSEAAAAITRLPNGDRLTLEYTDTGAPMLRRQTAVGPDWRQDLPPGVGLPGATLTVLLNGQVMIAGGKAAKDAASDRAAVFDPDSGRFDVLALQQSLAEPRAELLANGDLLLWQGDTGAAQRFDPGSREFSAYTGALPPLVAPYPELAVSSPPGGRERG